MENGIKIQHYHFMDIAEGLISMENGLQIWGFHAIVNKICEGEVPNEQSR